MNFAYSIQNILFVQGTVMGIAFYSAYTATFEYIETFCEIWADKIF